MRPPPSTKPPGSPTSARTARNNHNRQPPAPGKPASPKPGAIQLTLAETLGKTFNTGAQLASYAGLAPVTRRSGSSIRGEHVSHGGNKRLKRAMFPSAFASLRSDPVSRAYYQRKRDQGKRHNQAVLALAHRRILTRTP